MKKFEYRQIEYNDYPSTEELNKEGVDGWDLVHIFPTKKYGFDRDLECIYEKDIYKTTFKREIYGSN